MRRVFLVALALVVALVMPGCMVQRSVQILPGPTVMPGAINIAQAQQAVPTPQPMDEVLRPEISAETGETPGPGGPLTPDGTPVPIDENDKIVYLTFDDGPSDNTSAILSILAEEQVPATFFILGVQAEKYPDHIKEIAAQGHLVANHSYSHKTDEIYQSLDALLEDIAKCANVIKDLLGEDYPTDLFRFPRGSTNKACRDYREGVKAAGYRYFDWNALNGDAETGEYKRTPEELYDRLVQTVSDVDGRKKEITVLMHDTNSKGNTALMLKDAIQYLKGLGYEFRTMEYAQMHN